MSKKRTLEVFNEAMKKQREVSIKIALEDIDFQLDELHSAKTKGDVKLVRETLETLGEIHDFLVYVGHFKEAVR